MNKVLNRFGKVAVLMGGKSQEREVSLNSGKCVLNSLLEKGVDAHPFDPYEEEIFTLKTKRFDRVFNALHGGMGENGALQGALDIMGLPYTGDGVLPSALGFDKVKTKMIWSQAGLSIPNYSVIRESECIERKVEKIVLGMRFPLFVKPANNGSSIGVCKVYSEEELFKSINIVLQKCDDALIEEAIEGDEYTYTLLRGFNLPLIRILFSGSFFDYHSKYVADNTQYLVPCGLEKKKEDLVAKLCYRAFHVLGCKNWGRVDFIIDRNGNCYFLELNTSPGLTDHSLSPKAAAGAGIDYGDLVIQLLGQTLVPS